MPENFRNDLTAEYVRARLDYDPVTGIFRWRDHPDNGVRTDIIGIIAGAISPVTGYRAIELCQNSYQSSRLAWLYVYGEWPDTILDHENRIRHDDRIDNLRKFSRVLNSINRGIDHRNTSGYRGVSWSTSKQKWVAQTSLNKKKIWLGTYPTRELAFQAYCTYMGQNHGIYFDRELASSPR